MSKHTPGPWLINGHIIEAFPCKEEAPNYVAPVCYTDSDWSESQQIANASLIASAPDLLAALESLFEHCAMIHKQWGSGSNERAADAAIESARAAIRKAKGE